MITRRRSHSRVQGRFASQASHQPVCHILHQARQGRMQQRAPQRGRRHCARETRWRSLVCAEHGGETGHYTHIQAAVLGAHHGLATQPYYDEFEVRKVQHAKAREQYFKTVDPKVLKEINKKRKERGLSKIRAPTKGPQHTTPYLRSGGWKVDHHFAHPRLYRFVSSFRSTSEGDAIMKDKSHAEKPVLRLGRAAGERWRNMSDDEKYVRARLVSCSRR